ncbi:hypothetical protein [Sphingorhabdus contaminans]|uniref:hypothetical protein n=1 Tax=Sphingorhabdus contaminans TaxID=1343899 RepID=UPI003D2D93DB
MPAPTSTASMLKHSALLAKMLEGPSSGIVPKLVTRAKVNDKAIVVDLSVTGIAHLLKLELPAAE